MPTSWTRREFLTAAATLPLAGGAALRALEPVQETADRDAWQPTLPPRVVGLKTKGGNFRFDPEGLRIERGETLRWLNMGDFHTTTAFHPDYADLVGGDLPLRIPEGSEPWHSGMLGSMPEPGSSIGSRRPAFTTTSASPTTASGWWVE